MKVSFAAFHLCHKKKWSDAVSYRLLQRVCKMLGSELKFVWALNWCRSYGNLGFHLGDAAIYLNVFLFKQGICMILI